MSSFLGKNGYSGSLSVPSRGPFSRLLKGSFVGCVCVLTSLGFSTKCHSSTHTGEMSGEMMARKEI